MNKKKINNSELGAILPLLAITLVLIIGIAALLIDLSRGNYTANTIQEAVDSATLSGVRLFKGTQEGWDNARSAALLALQTNQISEVQKGALDGINLNINGVYGNSTVGKQNGLIVTIARGIYWEDGGSQKFVSLEEGASTIKGPWNNKDFSKEVYANALKVELTVEKQDVSAFSKLQNGNKSYTLTKTSTGITDNQLSYPAFPGGLSFCQLMLETDSNVETNHMLQSYDPSKQINREIFFTELEGFVTGSDDPDNGLPTASEERREGIRRYLSNISMPIFEVRGSNLCNKPGGSGPSCKHTPIQALLGVAGTTPGEASLDEIKGAFEGNNVKLGQYFRPLREWPQGDLSEFTEAMNEFLNSGERQSIKDRYVEIRNGLKHAKPNFPAVRHPQIASGEADFMRRPPLYFGKSDMDTPNRIPWLVEMGQSEINFGLIANIKRTLGVLKLGAPSILANEDYVPFINPMCNSATTNLDNMNYQVKTFNVMVIAPGVDNPQYNNGEKVTYCDFDNQFSSQRQSARVPWLKNEPRVIGVVPIDFIGFNFEDLALKFPSPLGINKVTPAYTSNEPNGLKIEDNTPAELEITSWFENEITQYETEYNNCEQNYNSCNITATNNIVLPASIANCFDLTNFNNFKTDVDKANEFANGYQNSNDQCNHKIDVCRDYKDCAENDPNPVRRQQCEASYAPCPGLIASCTNTVNDYNNKLTVQLNLIKNKNLLTKIPALPNAHCVPIIKEDQFDFNSASSYEELRPLKAGRGCGGVRARVAYTPSEKLALTTGKSWDKMKPILVDDGN